MESENESGAGPGHAQGVWRALHVVRRLRQSDDEALGPFVPYLVQEQRAPEHESEEEGAVSTVS